MESYPKSMLSPTAIVLVVTNSSVYCQKRANDVVSYTVVSLYNIPQEGMPVTVILVGIASANASRSIYP